MRRSCEGKNASIIVPKIVADSVLHSNSLTADVRAVFYQCVNFKVEHGFPLLKKKIH